MTAVTAPSLPGVRRLTPAATVRHSLTLAWRTLVQIRHNPMELLDYSIQPIMFVLLFTYVLGGQMAGGDQTAYLRFVLPGMIAQNALFTTLYTGVGLNTDITKGVFDRLRALPIARTAPLAGRILADVVKQAWAMGIVIAAGMAIGYRLETSVFELLLAFLLLLVVALAFSWVAVLIGVVVSEPEKVQVFGFTTIFPVTFTSSAFVNIHTMPGWLQAWAKVNPVTAFADAMRGLMNGDKQIHGIMVGSKSVASPTIKVLLWSVALAAVFGPLAVRALRRRV